ncbi:MAG: type IX secretion system membrane protein PorP/SprF [Bacteroidota bacterium]
MKKILYIFFLSFVSLTTVFGQQESHFTHFMYNQQIVNPGFVGSRGVPSVMALYRNQWLDIDGAPQNTLISFSSPFLDDRVGFGLSVQRRTIGLQEDWYANLAYSYGIPLTERLTVRVGLQGSGYFNQIDFTNGGQGLTVFNSNDPSILNGMESTQLKGNFGAGILVHSERYYIGLAVPYFLNNQLGFNEEVNFPALKERHYYGMIGFLIPVSDKIRLRQAFLGKYVSGAPFQLDANLSFILDNKFSLGVSYRTASGPDDLAESLDFLLFLNLSERIGLGVAYDFTLSSLKNYNNGTFELMVRYDLKKRRDDLENGRYFIRQFD